MSENSQNTVSVDNAEPVQVESIQTELLFGKKRISFTIHYDTRKTLSIQVQPTGEVRVIAPVGSPLNTIMEKVRSKAVWILRQQAFFLSFEPRNKHRQYVNGESHWYLGRQYRLKAVASADERITAARGYLTVYMPDPTPEAIQQKLENWYRYRAKDVFLSVIEESLKLFERYRLVMPVVDIRKMEKRWGSCTTGGKLILNTELIKAPKNCIRYVVIHELCHLINHSHNRAFYELLGRTMPDWAKWKDKLEKTLA